MTVEINGKPAAKLRICLAEKIGLPKFSNVDVGPIELERYVEDDPKAIAKAKDEMLEFVEGVLADERTKILKFLKADGTI